MHPSFTTDRLTARPWHDAEVDLPGVITRILTPATTATLPEEWHGAYTLERARRWITARDADSPTLLVRTATGPIGLLMVHEDDGHLMVGYVLEESAWGNGYASELVAGLVASARAEPSIRAISGGVEPGNEASARVLRKNGFVRKPGDADVDTYTLTVGA